MLGEDAHAEGWPRSGLRGVLGAAGARGTRVDVGVRGGAPGRGGDGGLLGGDGDTLETAPGGTHPELG